MVFEPSHGIIEDTYAGMRHRQVSIEAKESIDTLRVSIPNLAYGALAENIIVTGVPQSQSDLKSILKILSIVLEVPDLKLAVIDEGYPEYDSHYQQKDFIDVGQGSKRVQGRYVRDFFASSTHPAFRPRLSLIWSSKTAEIH